MQCTCCRMCDFHCIDVFLVVVIIFVVCILVVVIIFPVFVVECVISIALMFS
jgi:hypothetical protein